MGRTVPSFRIALNSEIKSWNAYRKALDSSDQMLLTEMLNLSRRYCSAASTAVRLSVFEGLCVAVLVDHHKSLMELASEIERVRGCCEGS